MNFVCSMWYVGCRLRVYELLSFETAATDLSHGWVSSPDCPGCSEQVYNTISIP